MTNTRNHTGAAPWMGSPLFGRYDKDPGRYRPRWEKVEIDVGVTAGAQGRGSIVIGNEPFCIVRAAAKIVGNTAVPGTSGLYQDGQFDIEWKDQLRNYVNGPIAADLMWNSVVGGYQIDFPFPLPYSGNEVLTFVVTNRVTRTLTPTSATFAVQIVVSGITDLGE